MQDWVYAYRDGGIGNLQPKPRPGRPTKLPRNREAELMARLDAGPKPVDGGVCTLRGKDVVAILQREFGVKYSLDGAYELLERLGYSCLSPRPLHEKADPAAVEQFKTNAPLVDAVRDALVPHGGQVCVWFMDEARFGQQGTITNVWARTGSRPRAVRQTRYEWVYLYAAVEPASGESVALLAPNVDTGTMNGFLRILDTERKPGEQFVLIMDQAGWHKSRTLELPEGITVLLLPAYSPELNPVENLWHYLRSHYLATASTTTTTHCWRRAPRRTATSRLH